MHFRNARKEELEKIFALYKSVVGSKFCVWNERYPGMDELGHDFETENLFVLTEDEQLVGAASVVPENEMDAYAFWTVIDGTERELARVVIAESFQGRGLAGELVNSVIRVLKQRGCAAARISVAAGNIPAIKTYKKIGFEIVGESDMYDNHYYLLEKIIR